MSITLVSASDAGHRASYIALFSQLFPATLRRSWQATLLRPRPALFLMIEENTAGYVLAAIWRSLFGWRTAGLLFRPGPAVNPTRWTLRAKAALLRMLRRLPRVTTLTLLPFALDPRMKHIADDWIHDPQLWDLTPEDIAHVTGGGTFANQFRDVAAGRTTILALGRQDCQKGFDHFVSLYAGPEVLRRTTLFAYAGAVHPEVAGSARQLAELGGFGIDRSISDDELLQAYAAADLVWCAYSADYDQASGIWGRATQLGIPAIVRAGSLIHRLGEAGSIPYVALGAGEDLPESLPRRQSPSTARTDHWRRHALATLSAALGVEARP